MNKLLMLFATMFSVGKSSKIFCVFGIDDRFFHFLGRDNTFVKDSVDFIMFFSF